MIKDLGASTPRSFYFIMKAIQHKGDSAMSLLKSTLEKLATKGTISKDVPINGSTFRLEVLSTEEQILADSIIRSQSLKDKFGAAEGDFTTLQDTLAKYRTLSILCLAIRSIDNVAPVDTTADVAEQFKQRMEFRDELGTLNTAIVDKLMAEYWAISDEQKKFFDDVIENAGK